MAPIAPARRPWRVKGGGDMDGVPMAMNGRARYHVRNRQKNG
jgi:hypothetical protein